MTGGYVFTGKEMGGRTPVRARTGLPLAHPTCPANHAPLPQPRPDRVPQPCPKPKSEPEQGTPCPTLPLPPWPGPGQAQPLDPRQEMPWTGYGVGSMPLTFSQGRIFLFHTYNINKTNNYSDSHIRDLIDIH